MLPNTVLCQQFVCIFLSFVYFVPTRRIFWFNFYMCYIKHRHTYERNSKWFFELQNVTKKNLHNCSVCMSDIGVSCGVCVYV